MMKKYEPIELFTIKDFETLKVVADPLRGQIMESLLKESHTANQIADLLGLATSKLYYHMNLLEKHGLIKVVDTTTRGNLIEKHYRVSALNYGVDHELLNFSTEEGKQHIHDMFNSILDTTRDDIKRSLEARAFNLEQGAEEHPRRVLTMRTLGSMSDEKANEFMDRFQELVHEFESYEGDQEDNQVHALTIMLYPSFHYDHTEENTE